MTTQKQIRDAFWAANPALDFQAREAGIRSKSQNNQCATLRCAFVDFVDGLEKSNQISESLAQRATL
jgi:hypothetical protein